MVDYRVCGAKTGDFKAYHTVNYAEKLISEIDAESVENYSQAFAKIFKWLQSAISLRK
jgi:hypothetical protein